MKILFATKRFTLKRFVPVVVELAARGHEIVIAYPADPPRGLPFRLKKTPRVTLVRYDETPDRAFPDAAVLVSPLVRQAMHQTEIVKAAAALGIPSGGLVYSWDSLSNKSRIHVAPDRLFVWNEVQRREAVELHGIAPERVAVTGAANWDRFFALRPSVSRDELCAQHGFDPAEPIVLYLGSTNEVCPHEAAVVERWLSALRASTGRLSRAN